MNLAIVFGVGGIIFFIFSVMFSRRGNILICITFLFGVIFILLSMGKLLDVPNGLPVELKADGLYEVKVVDVYTEESGSQWIAVQIIKEEGKTIEGRLPYRKISKSKFGNANIVYGIPLTIELKTFPSQQYLAVK